MRPFLRCARGNVAVLAGLSLPMVIGSLGLAVELGNGYATKVKNQAAADAAAMSGARVYSASTSQSQMTQAVLDQAAASGIANADVSSSIVSPPDGSSGQALKVTVRTAQPYYFSKVLGLRGSFMIAAVAFARIGSSNTSAPCIIMLKSTGSVNGVYVNGGSTLTATSCEVQANKPIYVNGGSTATAMKFYSGGTVTYAAGSSISTTPTAGNIQQNQTAVSDPLASDTAISTGLATVGTYTAVQVPTMSFTGGSDFAPAWYPTTYSHSGYSGTFNSSTSTWTFPSGTYNIANLNVGGGLKVVFTGPVTLNITGSIVSTGAGLTIGAGSTANVYVKGGITVSGGSFLTAGDGTFAVLGTTNNGATMTVGNGRHYFGPISVNANFTLGTGDSDFNGTMTIGGSWAMRIGAGNFAITKSTGQSDAVTMTAGGSTFQTGNGTFSVNGNFNSAGASTVTIGQTANHYINGNFNMSANTTLGAGKYFINGNFYNATTGTMTATDVTFLLAGTINLGGSANVNFSAPAAGSAWGIPEFLFITRNSGATSITGGSSSNVVTGIVYAPNSNITINSGGGISGGGACWSLVGQTLTIDGGARLGTAQCNSLASNAGGGSGTTELIQ